MKKNTILTIICLLTALSLLASCDQQGENREQTERSLELDSSYENEGIAEILKSVHIKPASPRQEDAWTEEKIQSAFAPAASENGWEILACCAVTDSASGRVGAVLSSDETGAAFIAFMDPDGSYQVCGTGCPAAPEPEFSYLGNGSVSFWLNPDGKEAYRCVITFSEENGEAAWRRTDMAE